MRILKVEKCDDPDCPFFKRISHYDYDDECRCLKNGEEIPQYKINETTNGCWMDKYVDLSGVFPEWCPLAHINNDVLNESIKFLEKLDISYGIHNIGLIKKLKELIE